jgi:hypothetical protein
MAVLRCTLAADAIGFSTGPAREVGRTDPEDPINPEDSKVVPLFRDGWREELVPIAAATEQDAAGGVTDDGQAGPWGEQRSAELLEDPPIAEGAAERSAITTSTRAARVLSLGVAAAAVTTLALVLSSAAQNGRTPAHVLAAVPPLATSTAGRTNRYPGDKRYRSNTERRSLMGRIGHDKKTKRELHRSARHRSVEVVSYQSTATETAQPQQTAAPVTAPVQSAPVTPTSSPAHSASSPAFGAAGVLGPGTSPDS